MIFTYLVGVFAVILVFILSSLGGGANSLSWFVDLPSILLLALIVIPVLFSSGLLKDFGRAFKITFSSKKEYSLLQMKNSICAINLFSKALLVASCFITTIACIIICGQLDNLLKVLGPNLAVVLLSFCYSFFFILLLLPLKAIIERKINEKLCSDDSIVE